MRRNVDSYISLHDLSLADLRQVDLSKVVPDAALCSFYSSNIADLVF